jgi:hypothetical protein
MNYCRLRQHYSPALPENGVALFDKGFETEFLRRLEIDAILSQAGSWPDRIQEWHRIIMRQTVLAA